MAKLNVNINPSASLYELVERTRQDTSLYNNRQAMLIISHEIEEAIILSEVRARVFSGFQRMSRFIPQVQRYRKLAHFAETIYVFGIMDVKPPSISRIRYVPLKEGDQLANEWFLVADSPNFYSVLATQETETQRDRSETPMFRGVWSFDEELIVILQSWLTDLVGALPLPDHAQTRDEKQHLSAMTNSLLRMTKRLTNALGEFHTITPKDAETTIHISAAVEKQIGPSVKNLADRLNRA